MPNLIELDATWMNVDLLESLEYLQKLERLSLVRLQGSMSSDNIYFEPSFKGSSRIKEFNMADSNPMTDSALASITSVCPKICVLNVSGNRFLTHKSLVQWCDHLAEQSNQDCYESGLDSRQTLRSGGVGAFIVPRLVGMTELTIINFANCNGIGPQGFQALFKRSRYLQDVNLMSTQIEDEGLQLLSDNNSGLHTLILNCCAGISDEGLKPVLRKSQHLKVVSFLYCNRITIKAFFGDLWGCLELEELRFSFSNRHADLIEHGITDELPANNPENEDQTQSISTFSPKFYESQLELMIFGKPYSEDSNPGETDGVGSLVTVQEYRQRLILTQFYRQIERFKQLQILDMRTIHLPVDLVSGFCRLEQLEKLQVLELTGLEQPLGPSEIAWLSGAAMSYGAEATSPESRESNEAQVQDARSCQGVPLPHLQSLVFNKGRSMSSELLKQLKCYRPGLDVQLVQVTDRT
ncbi:hypothetical protein B0O80DRAFT_429885 [Mortierella sp. GBAus27b]|nr:hypothetical protein BGX31_004099 [Mortierella sp. GBA43]KAI8347894.1 hypothetical protein B0O80DRAFT_429885 [Mortierella sp. GBAus27b]